LKKKNNKNSETFMHTKLNHDYLKIKEKKKEESAAIMK